MVSAADKPAEADLLWEKNIVSWPISSNKQSVRPRVQVCRVYGSADMVGTECLIQIRIRAWCFCFCSSDLRYWPPCGSISDSMLVHWQLRLCKSSLAFSSPAQACTARSVCMPHRHVLVYAELFYAKKKVYAELCLLSPRRLVASQLVRFSRFFLFIYLCYSCEFIWHDWMNSHLYCFNGK